MRLAEVFLRLGLALVAWMILYAHMLWLAVTPRIPCGDEGAELHGVLLGLIPLTLLIGPLILSTRPLGDVHAMLRWLAAPLVAIAPFSLYAAWQVFSRVQADGQAICGSGIAPAWQAWWGPVQGLVILYVGLLLAFAWKRTRAAAPAH